VDRALQRGTRPGGDREGRSTGRSRLDQGSESRVAPIGGGLKRTMTFAERAGRCGRRVDVPEPLEKVIGSKSA
jgi:hypothetical protein